MKTLIAIIDVTLLYNSIVYDVVIDWPHGPRFNCPTQKDAEALVASLADVIEAHTNDEISIVERSEKY